MHQFSSSRYISTCVCNCYDITWRNVELYLPFLRCDFLSCYWTSQVLSVSSCAIRWNGCIYSRVCYSNIWQFLAVASECLMIFRSCVERKYKALAQPENQTLSSNVPVERCSDKQPMRCSVHYYVYPYKAVGLMWLQCDYLALFCHNLVFRR